MNRYDNNNDNIYIYIYTYIHTHILEGAQRPRLPDGGRDMNNIKHNVSINKNVYVYIYIYVFNKI